jgi:3-hydroxymyristoyl/3-hydroxydecanoyl-(acyl carrier protein) dehydratase
VTATATHPEVLKVLTRPMGVAMKLRVPASLTWFRGHFPQCPILPGVVQLAWAVSYGEGHFGFEPVVERVVGLKFLRVIRPGAELELELDWSDAERCLSFRFSERESTCSSGRVVLAALALMR